MIHECHICKNKKNFVLPSDIIEELIKGNLVLFCGSGISSENKTVLPHTFYSDICNELKCEETKSFSVIMSNYCNQDNGRIKLIKKIMERFDYIKSFRELYDNATKFHKELSRLYMIDTIVTTNWDDFFERECRAIPIVYPHDLAFWKNDYRKVFKVHGSITNFSTIVATEDDYKTCYNNMKKNVIGAKLKSILSSQTVVFIGYSFGDEDLNKIFKFVRDEMKDYMPHIYIVTIDSNFKEKFDYPNATIINTDGTFFLTKLREHLEEKKYLNILESEDFIAEKYTELQANHELIASIDCNKFPFNIYSLCYQDGMIHAFERFMELKNTGQYFIPGFISSSASAYEEKAKDFKKQKLFFDEAYSRGYLDGLVGILMKKNEIEMLPFFFIPPNNFLTSISDYFEKLETENHNDYYKIARKFFEENDFEDLIIHHPPIL